MTLGPIHIVIGPIRGCFPEEAFEVFAPDQNDRAPLRPGVGPQIVRPAGFFKVIYRRATAGEEAQTAAFLVPHTHQRSLSFWSFLATVAVLEAASGLVFGFDERLKHGGRQGFWLARRTPGD